MKDDGNPRAKSDKPMAETDIRLALEAFRDGIYRNFKVCFPACVYSYDKSTHKADVMPLVKQAYYNGKWNYIRRGIIKGVSVRAIQCGGFTIEIPLHIGDTGWVFSSDRDTQLIKKEGTLTNSVLAGNRTLPILEDDYQQEPNQMTLHDFTQGFFLPDNWGRFEDWRYKDNPNIAVGEALYIGSSMDTNDEKAPTEEKPYQNGSAYEGKVTSSLVLLSNGGATLASASDNETNQNAHVSVDSNKVEMVAEDNNEERISTVQLDTENGISIRQDDSKNQRHFICSINKESFLLRMMDGENRMSFYFADGRLNVSTSNDVNMNFGGNTNFRCSGNVNVTSEKDINLHAQGNMNAMVAGDASVKAKDARVVAEKTASVSAEIVSASAANTANVNAGDTVNIGAAKTTNINAGETVNLASGKKINITSPDEINIVTASKTNILAKKKGAEITVKTMSKESKVDIKMEGNNSNLGVHLEGKESKVEVATNEEKSSISITAAGNDSHIGIAAEGEKSNVSIATKGTSSNIEIAAEGEKSNIDIEAKNEINIDAKGDTHVASDKTVYVYGGREIHMHSPGSVIANADSISLNGSVAIQGSLTLNGTPFLEKEHKSHEGAKYWAWA